MTIELFDPERAMETARHAPSWVAKAWEACGTGTAEAWARCDHLGRGVPRSLTPVEHDQMLTDVAKRPELERYLLNTAADVGSLPPLAWAA